MKGTDPVRDAFGPMEVDELLYGENALSMKPLLMVAIQEAVKLALIDSINPPETDEEGQAIGLTDAQKRDWLLSGDDIPRSLMATVDPAVLARNIGLRLLGRGGWTVGSMYTAHSSPAQVLAACVQRPDRDPTAEMEMALGSHPEKLGWRRI